MTKQKKNTNPAAPDTEALRQALMEAEKQQVQQAENAVADVEQRYGVSIGLRLDVQRLSQIITFMITNRQDSVTLKYEIWK
ncbi:MAG: hypothetical protein IPM52_13175 [Bacteroidetes bacterium]|nr:hypothetical protein [Bacteroidota bacterium]